MASTAAQLAASPLRSPLLNWLVTFLLAGCYTLAYLDRQIISLLIEPIQQDLAISDTEFGLLQGVSFSLFYVAASLPLAWLADRTRRSFVMSGCVAFWSAMTMACGLAASFWQMMLARIGVAVGESGLTPAALATLSDRFDRRLLASATAFYMLAPFVGGGLALGAGGALYSWAQRPATLAIPLFAGFSSWQIVFLVIGAFGLVPAAALLLIRDRPVRVAEKGPEPSRGFGEVFAIFRRHWKIYMTFQLAIAIVMVLLSSYVTWLPAAIMRSKEIDEAQVGSMFGPIYFLSGTIGTLSAGFLVTKLAGDDPVRTVMRYMLLMLALLWPLASVGLLTDSLEVELAMVGAALFLVSSVTSLSSLSFQYITPRHLRAQAIAIMAMVAALFGTGLGPVVAGVMSDQLASFAHPLSASLAIIGFFTTPVAMALIWIALRYHAATRLDLQARDTYPV